MSGEIDRFLADRDKAAQDFRDASRSLARQVEALVFKFLEERQSTIVPLLAGGVDVLAVAAGSATGPMAPLVTSVVEAFGRAGLAALVKWVVAHDQPLS